jgi:hypothetical protein
MVIAAQSEHVCIIWILQAHIAGANSRSQQISAKAIYSGAEHAVRRQTEGGKKSIVLEKKR